MFPENTTTQTIQDTTTNNVISDGEKIYKTPDYDFDDFQTVTKNVKRFELLIVRYINSFNNFVKSLMKN